MARKNRIASLPGLLQTLEATTSSSSVALPAATDGGRRAGTGGLAPSTSTLATPSFSSSKPDDRSVAITFERKQSNDLDPGPLPPHPLVGRERILQPPAKPLAPVVQTAMVPAALMALEKPSGTPDSNAAQVTLPSAAIANGIATATTAAAPTIAAALTAPSLISSSALLDPSATFRLHSNPTATRTIYLDFNDHHHHDHQDE